MNLQTGSKVGLTKNIIIEHGDKAILTHTRMGVFPHPINMLANKRLVLKAIKHCKIQKKSNNIQLTLFEKLKDSVFAIVSDEEDTYDFQCPASWLEPIK